MSFGEAGGERAYQHGTMLMERGRFDEAIAAFHEALPARQDDPSIHTLIALCHLNMKRTDEATEAARRAIAVAPDDSMGHWAMGRIHVERNDYGLAEASAREALSIDPEHVSSWGLLAGIHLDKRRPQEALDATTAGLSIEPEDVQCLNLRAIALTRLGRKQEAEATVRAGLRVDPENAVSHANLGWTALNQGNHRAALDHFRDALRLEPDLEWARTGMLTALKARWFPYRWFLAYVFFVARLGPRASWGLIIGVWLATRVLRATAQSAPQLRFILIPVIALLIGAVVMTWLADVIFNTLLRMSSHGRMLLSPQEKLASTVFVLLLTTGALSFGLAFGVNYPPLIYAGFVLLALMIPFSHALGIDELHDRQQPLIFACGLALLGAVTIALAIAGPAELRKLSLWGFAIALLVFQFTVARNAIHR